ncbi:YlzJ-like family protein [Sporomusa aerivorans]|uniref:YlzJ-like family protein n=1 Tax=Sporomusa aerivorans TaxID=204936 RepID=UPI003529DD17
MVLWTIMPVEMIFQQEAEESQNNYEEVEYAGAKVMVERINDNKCRIVRIISSNPMDYLRDDIQPGVCLTYRPLL